MQVFRFYPDGVVLDVLVKPAPGPAEGRLVETWLRRDPLLGGVHLARYELSGGVVTFTARGHLRDEAVEVRGRWSGGRLVLDGWAGVAFQRIWPD
ncbi:hypothetical protein [Nonomuraea sp. SBT364]|uniref:hypothetical protein n=1 Tax=Nonomuraea sp. SBT364 TaxID=1580530 RepID=UPI00066D4A17|nr:hypothetical protein [Nonomuraea sp. SBT364]